MSPNNYIELMLDGISGIYYESVLEALVENCDMADIKIIAWIADEKNEEIKLKVNFCWDYEFHCKGFRKHFLFRKMRNLPQKLEKAIREKMKCRQDIEVAVICSAEPDFLQVRATAEINLPGELFSEEFLKVRGTAKNKRITSAVYSREAFVVNPGFNDARIYTQTLLRYLGVCMDVFYSSGANVIDCFWYIAEDYKEK